jgi:UDP-N-acetylmuramoylalanine--D-glutamate ligase
MVIDDFHSRDSNKFQNMTNHRSNPLDQFAAKRVIVMGLGRFGGGLGITRAMIDAGAEVTVTDSADPESLSESLTQLEDQKKTSRLHVELGPHDPALLDKADALIVNQAVPQPWKNSFVSQAISRNIIVTTEVELAYDAINHSNVIAVTGSAGKSTTSAMIHHVLKATGHDTVLGGNIGGSLLTCLDKINDDTVVVLELSSAMIYWLWGRDSKQSYPPAPRVACVTNYAPNHLDWHGGERHYRESKQQLLRALGTSSHAVITNSIAEWSERTKASCDVLASHDGIADCTVPGEHNATNAAMAVRAVEIFLAESNKRDLFIDAVRSFGGLEHRLNVCLQTDGLKFFNDSKSTIPQATTLAVEAVKQSRKSNTIHLIAGGYDKGSDLSPISELAPTLGGLYTIGATGEQLALQSTSNSFYCHTLADAVDRAIDRAKPGDSVLLSPGCASWDQFANYEERGNQFVALATERTRQKACSQKQL